MTHPLESLFAQSAFAPPFPPTSRYHQTPVVQRELPDGEVQVYLRRRFIPPRANFGSLRELTVQDGERLDQLAARHLGHPELFWQLCDANGVSDPAELEVPNRRLRIPLPEGVPEVADD